MKIKTLEVTNKRTGEVYEVEGTDSKATIKALFEKAQGLGLMREGMFLRNVAKSITLQATKAGKMYATTKQYDLIDSNINDFIVNDEKAETTLAALLG